MTNKSINSLFGKRLKALRLERNISAAEFQKLSGISPEVLDQYEAGKFEPMLTTMETIAKALKINLVDLLDFDTND